MKISTVQRHIIERFEQHVSFGGRKLKTVLGALRGPFQKEFFAVCIGKCRIGEYRLLGLDRKRIHRCFFGFSVGTDL